MTTGFTGTMGLGAGELSAGGVSGFSGFLSFIVPLA